MSYLYVNENGVTIGIEAKKGEICKTITKISFWGGYNKAEA